MQQQRIVGVMGIEGAGKSSLVKLLSDDESIEIGHDLSSRSTRTCPSLPFEVDGQMVALVDTYGIDGSREESERLVVKRIETCFRTAEKEGSQRAGLLWLHDISRDGPHMITDDTVKSLADLCATPDLHRLRIVTTRWESVPQVMALESEAQLRSGSFKQLLDAGAQMERHYGTLDSGRQILSRLLKDN
ncbi:hypothetical protein CERSUDRAFT_89902 [Gelatoporia subvermispora B]|uniref:G domain-containing protein n=1 Tax=Ceriporiopsis subvermispora (strain B) TaxID=914234 RepID=M2PWX4_CERS8|nr:hypothetical protein CERSUDRAFT_89902 [Gelatoporia subvermispora B]